MNSPFTSETVAIERQHNRIYVVETLSHGRWFPWTLHHGRPDAYANMRKSRSEYPAERFRTTPFDSTVNSHGN